MTDAIAEKLRCPQGGVSPDDLADLEDLEDWEEEEDDEDDEDDDSEPDDEDVLKCWSI